ncbi:hypothetical protein ACFVAJ_18525 [Agromyces sp. NPDC057679]|uniref:hypothetical protein n=1 Tax=Agromyces sp. NPDC057679 TaxID=3346207 RepID=UPI00366B0B1D
MPDLADEIATAPHIRPGDKIEGFGWGYFGRDSQFDKVCVDTGVYNGERWALFHEDVWSLFHTVHGKELVELEELMDHARRGGAPA